MRGLAGSAVGLQLVEGDRLTGASLFQANPGTLESASDAIENGGQGDVQPLSTVHGACYADYSHGIRLVSAMAIEDGALQSVRDLLQDSRLADALSDEGAIRPVLVNGTTASGEGRCGLGN